MDEKQIDKLFSSIFGTDMQSYCEKLVLDGKAIKIEGIGILINNEKNSKVFQPKNSLRLIEA